MKAKKAASSINSAEDLTEIFIEDTCKTEIDALSVNLHKTRAAFRKTPSNKHRPLVSILIFAFNNLERHTKTCVECIIKYTKDIDYELVLLDNGSSDRTFEYFKSIPYAKKKIVRITENKGANYGQFTATRYLNGRYVVMIANDVYVTANWLTNMIKCAESDDRIGFIATYSDNVSNLQAVDLGYTGLDDMYVKAEQYNVSDPRKWEERLRLMPAIAFYKRECLDIIGSLDYAFRHDFSDDDISFRVRRAGYKIICCGDTFVHHEGSSAQGSTAAKMGVLLKGRQIFMDKYYGVDAWEDVNNFELAMLMLVNPEDKRGIAKPEILGVDVKCGTPILQLKNKLRHADIFDAKLSAFVQDPKYWLDLKTICEGNVVVDRIQYLPEHFSLHSFDYILLGHPINAYSEKEKILTDLLSLLKTDGQLLIKLRNTFDIQAFFDSMKEGLGTGNKSIAVADINHLNTILIRLGYAIQTVKKSLYNIDHAKKDAIRNALEHSEYAQNIDAVFNELITEDYALKIIRYTSHENKAVDDKSALIHGPSTQTDLSAMKESQISPLKKEVISGMTSLIIVTNSQLEQTKKCVRSVQKHTPENHEIIFIANNSSDNTVRWLQGQVRENKNYCLIENKENIGITKGYNQGINASQGEFILFLDNHNVVGPGWLSGMLECLAYAPDSGIIGPMTNSAGGLQQVDGNAYRSVDYLDEYAAQFKEQYRHRRIPYRNISGLCMLFKRALIEEIGPLDERFDAGHFEDEDLCWRSALGDYQNYIAGDIFIHHSGSKIAPSDRSSINKKWTLGMATPEGKKLAVLRAVELADALYQKGKLDRAVETLINCIKFAPDESDIYYELVRFFLESKKFAEAQDVINSMPAAATNRLKGMEFAGYTKEGLGLDNEAEDTADKMLAMDGAYAPALNLKGVLAFKRGDKVRAQDLFKKAIEADPGYGEPYTNLGILNWGMEKKDEAFSYLQRGFILSPALPDISSSYYSAAIALGKFSQAESDFREASRLYPTNRNLAYLLIDLLIQQENFASAINEIESALDIYGLDEGTLNAALAVREKVDPLQIENVSKRGTLSLCMIVKNEEKHLVRCLRSVRDIVDEMIIVDTGSTDKTTDIAKVFGAKVFDFPWTGDFSAARNHSLAQASCDWILVLDGDEVVSERDFDKLKTIINKRSSSPAAYSIVTRNYMNNVGVLGWRPNSEEYPEEAGAGWVPSVKVRLFSRRKGILFSNPVHELLEHSLRKAKVPIYPCNIVVHHYGKLDMERDIQKGEDYYLLGKIKYESDPTNVKYIYELAKQAHQLQKYDETIDLWQKLLSLIEDNFQSSGYKEITKISFGDPLPEIYIQLALAYLMTDRFEEALAVSRKAMEGKVKLDEYLFVYAQCEIIAGSPDKATHELDKLLKTNPDYPPALLLMAVVFCLKRDNQKAWDLFQLLRKKNITFISNFNKIAKQLYTYGKKEESLTILRSAIESRMANEETQNLLRKYQI